MKKSTYRSLLILLAGLASTTAPAQYLPGLMSSNYGGIYRMLQNPSAAAGGRYRYQLVLGLGNSTINPTYFKYFTSNDFFYNLRLPYSNKLGRDLRSLGSITNAPRTTSYSELIGPSVLINLDGFQSIAVHTRLRSYLYGSSLPESLTEAYRNRVFSSRVSPASGNFNTGLVHSSYAEAGLTYGLQVFDGKWHRLKLGATLRRITGAQRSAFQASGNYSIQEQNGTSHKAVTINNLDYSVNFTAARQAFSLSGGDYGAGWGYDFGATYEIGRRTTGRAYNDDTPLHDPRPAYLLRLSAALVNGGRINYPQARRVSGANANVKFENQDQFEQFGAAPLDYLSALNGSRMGSAPDGSPGKVSLPRMVHLEADLRLARSFYVNGLLMENMSSGDASTPMPNMLLITPRFEDEDAELALPISVIGPESKVAVGMSARLGPVTLGFSDVGRVFKKTGDNRSSMAWIGLSMWSWKKKVITKR